MLNDVSHPRLEGAPHIRVVLVKIWKVREAAVLYLVLVIPVVDLAVGVVVDGLVERSDLREVHIHRANVVGDNIDHHPDTSSVSSVNKVDQVLLSTEIAVICVPVCGPVTMVALGIVCHDRADPDSIESHALDII